MRHWPIAVDSRVNAAVLLCIQGHGLMLILTQLVALGRSPAHGSKSRFIDVRTTPQEEDGILGCGGSVTRACYKDRKVGRTGGSSLDYSRRWIFIME